jgi:hypothetical protein
MNCNRGRIGWVLFGMFLQSATANAELLTVNFDPGGTPSIPTGPQSYGAVGPMKTITVPGKITISGGVVLGLSLEYPSAPFVTSPNIYGTATRPSQPLPSSITISIDPSFNVTEVGGALLSGEPIPISYAITAFNGATPVASETLALPAYGQSSGFGIFDVVSNPITSVTIAPLNLFNNQWDFFVDTLTFNRPVPEPSTLILAALGGLALLAGRSRLALKSRA